MDEEQRIAQLEEKLEDILDTLEDNTKALRSIQRTLRWSFWGKLLIWIVVLVLPFILLGPFLRAIVPGGFAGSDGKSLFGLPSQGQLKELLDTYRASHADSSSTSAQ